MKGSCLCEAIQYEIDSIDFPISHCHCLTCQKAHSAAFATTARVMREHFRWLRGSESVAAFESSPGKIRWFCPKCGSHLVAEKDGMPYVIVRVATLDEDPGKVPELHIWTSHDRPWLQYEEQVKHEEWQPGRTA